ncbi:MAG: hypothetical protein V3T33_09390 [Myxococcota bacterium]
MSKRVSKAPLAPLAVPVAVCEVVGVLRGAGHTGWLVGESLHLLVRGELATDYEISTSASTRQLLDLFPAAVPTRPGEETLSLPTKAGPVDLTPLGGGREIGDELRTRDFSVLALAYEPIEGEMLDPASGLADVVADRLCCVGDASRRLVEDPLRCLRAARLCAQHGYRPDAALAEALAKMSSNPASHSPLRPLRVRRELVPLLLSKQAATGISLLRNCGLEQVLVPGARADCAALIEALPFSLPLRLAAWLRGSPHRGLLRRLGFPLSLSEQVANLLEVHPIERAVNPARPAALRRLRQRLGEEELLGLCALRERELDLDSHPSRTHASNRAALIALRAGIERIRAAERLESQRTRLVLTGRQVMEILGCGPGRRVGAALRALSESVATGAVENSAAALRGELVRWSRTGGE